MFSGKNISIGNIVLVVFSVEKRYPCGFSHADNAGQSLNQGERRSEVVRELAKVAVKWKNYTMVVRWGKMYEDFLGQDNGKFLWPLRVHGSGRRESSWDKTEEKEWLDLRRN